MNRMRIDRVDLSFSGLGQATAHAVEAALPGAIQSRLAQRLTQRLSRHGVASALARLDAADLGTLDIGTRQDPRAVADAIALRLADWLDTQFDAATPAAQEP
jgi:hypothetical protein